MSKGVIIISSSNHKELKRRTIAKSLIWRIIGIVWTWLGTYFIITLVPPSYKNAPLIATLVVAYHHSTRMIMYYFYERIWTSVAWGKFDETEGCIQSFSKHDKLIWTASTLTVIAFIFFLIFYVGPMFKK